MQAVPQKIDYVEAQQERHQQDLAIAEQATDESRVAFLRRCLEELHRQLSNLREKENILLQRQVSGQQCLPCYIVTPLGWVACALFHQEGLGSHGILLALYLVSNVMVGPSRNQRQMFFFLPKQLLDVTTEELWILMQRVCIRHTLTVPCAIWWTLSDIKLSIKSCKAFVQTCCTPSA